MDHMTHPLRNPQSDSSRRENALIEGGIPTEALVAQVVVSRFADHQPLYRQAQMMAREGVIIERSTLSFWIGGAGQRFQRRSRWKGQRRVCRRRGCPCGPAVA
jgi:transposase